MNIEKLYELEAQLEKSLDQVREHIREAINRQDLNKAVVVVQEIYENEGTALKRFGTSWEQLSEVKVNPFTGCEL